MSQHNSHLDAFFQKAHSEPPVFSDKEIDALLDSADLHGRQSDTNPQHTRTDMLASTHNRKKRTIIMSSIAALLLGGLVSVGALYINSDASDQPLNTTNSTTVSNTTTQPEIAAAPSQAAGLTTMPVKAELNGRDQDRKNIVIPDNEKDGNDKEITVEEELSKELQQFVENYWLEKINTYKNRIDRMLDPASRAELDRLRVRYALLDNSDSPFNFGMQSSAMTSSDGRKVMIGARLQSRLNSEDLTETPDEADINEDMKSFNMAQFDFDVNAEDESGQNKVMFAQKNRIMVSDGEDLDMDELKAMLKEQGIDIDEENGEIHVLQSAEGNGKMSISIEADEDIIGEQNTDSRTERVVRQQVTINRKHSVEDGESKIIIKSTSPESEVQTMSSKPHVVLMHKDEAEYSDRMAWRMDDMDMSPIVGMLRMAISSDKSESSQIIVATWDLAEQHRAELDDLKAIIFEDLTSFKKELHQRLSDFAAAHNSEKTEKLQEMLADGNDSPFSEDGDLVKTLAPLYNVIAEPMILLYNGSDINGMLSSAIAEPVAGVSLEANTTLKQSYPNPATSEATIEYTLPAQSSATVLRLFDSKGSEVKRIDLGAQNAGNHSTMLNVADLPAGTYLYHLTTGTARGEQVYSKTMQVTR